MGRRDLFAGIAALLAAFCAAGNAGADAVDLIAALRSGGHIALMRHSIAPGTGDPANFRIGECATQRNLSAAGRAQAAAIGERLRENGLADARLVSSQWCRCLNTARLLSVGEVEELPFLNSLVAYPARREGMTRDLRRWIGAQELGRPTILVTHGINIRALTGSSSREGEIIIAELTSSGELSVVGSIPPLD